MNTRPVKHPVPNTTRGVHKTGYFKTKIVWFNLVGFFVMHLLGTFGALYCLKSAKILSFIWSFILIYVSGLGVTIGAHRLFTHRSFKATLGLRILLIILHTIAGQNCLYIWVRDHRQHHKYTDTDADPHNAGRGFFFSHIGWLMMKKHPDVILMGKTVDLSDLEADPIVMFQKKYYKSLFFVFSLLIPVVSPILLWKETFFNSLMICFFFRFIVQLNGTWMVNSWAHFFGTRPYNKSIKPVDSRLVSIVALGEGWHNFHHCFPWDYRTSEYGKIPNQSTALIDLAAYLGWAYDLKTVPMSTVRKRAADLGDGSYTTWRQRAPSTSDQLKNESCEANSKGEYMAKSNGNGKTTMQIKDNIPKQLDSSEKILRREDIDTGSRRENSN